MKIDVQKSSTGRLKTSEPEIQNIPIRTEEGSRIREAIIKWLRSGSKI